jgi:hypothetical protein
VFEECYDHDDIRGFCIQNMALSFPWNSICGNTFLGSTRRDYDSQGLVVIFQRDKQSMSNLFVISMLVPWCPKYVELVR